MACTEQVIKAACQDFHEKLVAQEKKGQEWVCRAEEAKDYRIQNLEKSLAISEQQREELSKRTEQLQEEVEHLIRETEDVEEHIREVLRERSAHVKLLHRIFWLMKRSAVGARLGDISTSILVMQSEGNLTLRFDKLADKLEGLQAKLKSILTQERR